MRAKNTIFSVGLLVLAVTVTGLRVEAGQRDSRGRDRNGRDSQGQSREGSGGSAEGGRRTDNPQVAPAPREQSREAAPYGRRGDGGQARNSTPPDRSRDDRGGVPPEARDGSRGSAGQAVPRRDRQDPPVFNRDRDDRGSNGRRETFRYDPYRDNRRYDNGYIGSPRLLPRRVAPRHYYGPGGGLSVYFGRGSGFLYGSPYYGRVYGYMAPPVYGGRSYYGDVRLQVRPRNAAVYVDGYYAGVVDDFDGVFQRLTIEVGPHEIELVAPGLEPQFYDVYVDPSRTVTIQTDLYPY